jgi:hypothetical protein
MLAIFTDGRSASIPPAGADIGFVSCCVFGCSEQALHAGGVEFICAQHWAKVDPALRIARGRLLRRLLRADPPHHMVLAARRTWRKAVAQASA